MSYLGGLLGKRIAVRAESVEELFKELDEIAAIAGGFVGAATHLWAVRVESPEQARIAILFFLEQFGRYAATFGDSALFTHLAELAARAREEGAQRYPDAAIFAQRPRSTVPPPPSTPPNQTLN